MDGTQGNPRSITLALIDAKLDTVLEKLAEFRASQQEHEKRIEALELASARHSERLGIVGTLNLAAAGIAAWIGARK